MNLYVDGSYCPKTKKSGIGLFIHPHKILSQSISVKATDSMYAELIAIIYGIHEAKPFKTTIYTDCRAIVDSFKKKHLIKGFEQWCKHIYCLLKRFGLRLMWVKRDKNKEADTLARHARKR